MNVSGIATTEDGAQPAPEMIKLSYQSICFGTLYVKNKIQLTSGLCGFCSVSSMTCVYTNNPH